MTTYRLRAAAVAASAAIVLALTACTSPPAADDPPPSATPQRPSPSAAPSGLWTPSGELATLASGLDAPWSVVALPDGGALLSERDTGAIEELTLDGELRLLGTVPDVAAGGEGGLLGLALLDDGVDRWLYAYHGTRDDNRVVRMPLLGEPGSLGFGDPELVIGGIPKANIHNGGRIAFGPDGMLYVATGDAGDRSLSQDLDSLGGKILRLTPTGQAAPGNPFDSPVYSLGHRNVQGLAWTSDGRLWASEFGQNTWDELNVIEPGANYGWPEVEGMSDAAGFTDPQVAWRTDEASPSGIAAVGDTVFVAALRGERVWVVDTAAGRVSGEPVAFVVGEQGRIRDAVAAPDGSLWLLTNNTDGRGSPRSADDLLLRVPLAAAP